MAHGTYWNGIIEFNGITYAPVNPWNLPNPDFQMQFEPPIGIDSLHPNPQPPLTNTPVTTVQHIDTSQLNINPGQITVDNNIDPNLGFGGGFGTIDPVS